MRLEIGRVDHHRLRNGRLGSQPVHHPGKNPSVAPPLPAVVESLRGAILPRGVSPPQTITIHEDYAAQHAAVIDAWLARGRLREGAKSYAKLRTRFPQIPEFALGTYVSATELEEGRPAFVPIF